MHSYRLMQNQTHDNLRQQAEADLAALSRQGDVIAGMAVGPTAAPASDPIERWGRWIGRSLSILAFAGLCAYLYVSHGR